VPDEESLFKIARIVNKIHELTPPEVTKLLQDVRYYGAGTESGSDVSVIKNAKIKE